MITPWDKTPETRTREPPTRILRKDDLGPKKLDVLFTAANGLILRLRLTLATTKTPKLQQAASNYALSLSLSLECNTLSPPLSLSISL